MTDTSRPTLEVCELWRTYRRGSEPVHALADFSLTVQPGEMVGIVGRSGSGKTTLLNQIGCLDRPTRGRVVIAGTDVTELPEHALARFRREHIGFIFQLFYLLPTLSVAENVGLPLLFARRHDPARVRLICERVGLVDRMGALPGSLDGGDMQRVAIARALINDPDLLLADEPTGRLERCARDEVLGLFDALRADGLAIVLATHDLEQAARCDRVIELRDGRIVTDGQEDGGLSAYCLPESAR
ncbi:MAG: ABC transporter ATP-binding protein [Armatimonadota bacterium]